MGTLIISTKSINAAKLVDLAVSIQFDALKFTVGPQGKIWGVFLQTGVTAVMLDEIKAWAMGYRRACHDFGKD